LSALVRKGLFSDDLVFEAVENFEGLAELPGSMAAAAMVSMAQGWRGRLYSDVNDLSQQGSYRHPVRKRETQKSEASGEVREVVHVRRPLAEALSREAAEGWAKYHLAGYVKPYPISQLQRCISDYGNIQSKLRDVRVGFAWVKRACELESRYG